MLKDRGVYTVDEALAAARTEARLNDFGDDDFMEPLEAFVTLVQSDVRFTEAGLLNFRTTIQRWLVNRLRFQRDLTAHPEILDEDVSDPIMILGMPRTGTTKLQRVMSADPKMQKLAFWRLLNPAPFDGESPSDAGSRLPFAKAVEEAMLANADFTSSHELAAEEADEDSFLLLLTFDYPLLFALFPSRAYLDWARARPRLAPHLFEKKMLQYLQWQDGGRRGRRWVLKNPGAVGCLAAVHEVFPKATFIHSHRDMLEVLPSFCRLMEAAMTPLVEDLDPLKHGRDSLAFWRHEMALYARDRSALGAAINVLDVSYLDIVRDPIPIIRVAYERAGLDFTSETQMAMETWSGRNQQHKHGKAVYSLEQYGLTPETIAAAFEGAGA